MKKKGGQKPGAQLSEHARMLILSDYNAVIVSSAEHVPSELKPHIKREYHGEFAHFSGMLTFESMKDLKEWMKPLIAPAVPTTHRGVLEVKAHGENET